jgi:hypothetical protein
MRFAACGFGTGCERTRSFRGTSQGRHDDEVSDNRKCRSSKGVDVFGIRYCYSLVCVNGTDLCAVHTAGISVSTRMRVVWRRGKAKINRLLSNAPPKISTARKLVYRLPYEIVEMIIAHITRDLDTVKAFSSTCRSWYIAAVPHLHHTLTLKDDILSTTRSELKPLSKLHHLGLMPLVKEMRVDQWHERWFVPREFSRRDLRYFSAFANVTILVFRYLDISHFIPGIECYFCHFSPTLRSIALSEPCCTPRQLSHFLSIFSNLDDIKIWQFSTPTPNITVADTELVPFSTPRLQGRLVVYDFDSVETWTRLIIVGGGLRFHFMELLKVGRCASALSEACAETLDTLRFYAVDASVGE